MNPSFEELLALHSPNIHFLARELHATKGWLLSYDELFVAGTEGFFEAFQRFDRDVGAKFWTFAYSRVRGAMMDAIRQAMPMPMTVYRPLSAARKALHASKPGTRAHQDALNQLAEANETLGVISYDAVAATRGEALGVHDGLDRVSIEDEDGPAPHVDPVDDGTSRVMCLDAPDPEQALEHAQRLAALHAAIGQLTIEERLIVRGLYLDERGLVDEDIGISKSWASRIHTRALRRLRAMLEPEWGCGSRTVARPDPVSSVLSEPEVVELASNDAPTPPAVSEPAEVVEAAA